MWFYIYTIKHLDRHINTLILHWLSTNVAAWMGCAKDVE